MASVTLDHLWIQNAGDYTDYVQVYLTEKSEATDREGEIRRYAGGRLRAVTFPGVARSWVADLRLATVSQYDDLVRLQEFLCLWRDHLGGIMFGRYYQLDARREQGPSGFVRRVRVRFDEVTHTVEV